MVGYTLKAKQEVEKVANWKYCNGKLPAGKYRINKNFRYIYHHTVIDVWDEKKYIVSIDFSLK